MRQPRMSDTLTRVNFKLRPGELRQLENRYPMQ